MSERTEEHHEKKHTSTACPNRRLNFAPKTRKPHCIYIWPRRPNCAGRQLKVNSPRVREKPITNPCARSAAMHALERKNPKNVFREFAVAAGTGPRKKRASFREEFPLGHQVTIVKEIEI